MQGDGIVALDRAQLFAQEAFRLLRREAQVAHVEFDQGSLQAQPFHREFQRTARAERQMQLRRCVIQQPLQGLQDARVSDMVQVIDHQHQFALAPGQRLHQGDHPQFDGRVAAVGPDRSRGFPGGGRIGFADAGQQAVNETRRVIVLGRQRQPADVIAQRQDFLAPCHQGTGLAAACLSLDHHAALPARLQQAVHQRFARHELACAARGQHPGAGHRPRFPRPPCRLVFGANRRDQPWLAVRCPLGIPGDFRSGRPAPCIRRGTDPPVGHIRAGPGGGFDFRQQFGDAGGKSVSPLRLRIAQEALDHAQPCRGAGGQLHTDTRVLLQPLLYFRVIVAGVADGQHPHPPARRRGRLHVLQEGQPGFMADVAGRGAGHAGFEHRQRGHQRGGQAALVGRQCTHVAGRIVRRQRVCVGLGPILDRKRERMHGRERVQRRDIHCRGGRICRRHATHVAADAGPQSGRTPVARNAGRAHPEFGGEAACAPVARRLRAVATGQQGQARHVDLRRRRAARQVLQDAAQARQRIAFAPARHLRAANAQQRRDGLVLFAFGGEQDDARTLRQPCRRIGRLGQCLEFGTFLFGQVDSGCNTHRQPLRIGGGGTPQQCNGGTGIRAAGTTDQPSEATAAAAGSWYSVSISALRRSRVVAWLM
ncbi:hypothetical protein D9M72_314070 [compost metagenome]